MEDTKPNKTIEWQNSFRIVGQNATNIVGNEIPNNIMEDSSPLKFAEEINPNEVEPAVQNQIKME